MADQMTAGPAGIGLGLAGSTLAAGGQLMAGRQAAAAGRAQRAASEFEATQLDDNAFNTRMAGAHESGERRLVTNAALGSSRARAGASGIDAGTGSARENEGTLAQRGEYLALMDLWNADNAATGLENKATGVRYSGALAEWEGKQKQKLSKLTAAGTLASGAGSALSSGSKLSFPTPRGSFGA